MPANAKVYKDDGGGWRWRIRAGNGEIVAVSSESYTRRIDAERGLADAERAFADVQAQLETTEGTDDAQGHQG